MTATISVIISGTKGYDNASGNNGEKTKIIIIVI